MIRLVSLRLRYAGCLGVLTTAFVLLPACSVTTKLTSPLPIRDADGRYNEDIGLHIPESSRNYVWKGNINVVPYSVEFGNALEPNAKYALSKIYRNVILVDKFPETSLSLKDVPRSVSIEIENANVTPGALTTSPSFAELRLKAIFSKDGKIEGDIISVHGRAESSTGSAGCIPLLNQLAYNEALQKAAERAMTDALDQLNDQIIKRRGKTW